MSVADSVIDFAVHFEQAMGSALAPLGLARTERDDVGVDFATKDRALVVEVKSTRRGPPREIVAAATQLAVGCRRLRAGHGVLAWWCATFSPRRVRETWDALASVLAPDVASRLQLVMVSPAEQLVIPEGPPGTQIADAIRGASTVVAEGTSTARPDRSYEVMKILFMRWLRRDPPISMGELMSVSGLSHPTVATRVRELGSAVERTSNRGVALRALPAAAWNELLALSPRVRRTVGYEDRSGRAPDPRALIERLKRLRPPHVALGGVIAARHWQPSFDLDGVPRIDLELHTPTGGASLGFLHRLDPALGPVRDDAAPSLVVHQVTRASSFFETDPAGGLPLADPVEVLLDLHQLRLHAQADELVRFLRRRS